MGISRLSVTVRRCYRMLRVLLIPASQLVRITTVLRKQLLMFTVRNVGQELSTPHTPPIHIGIESLLSHRWALVKQEESLYDNFENRALRVLKAHSAVTL